MGYHFNQKNHEIQYFNCSNNNSSRKTCPTTHYIQVDFLEQVVRGEIRRLTKFARLYENEFASLVLGYSQQVAEDEEKCQRKALAVMTARDRELDSLFECIYEDNVGGKINDERFAKMSQKYEQEQGELAGKIKAIRSDLEKLTDKAMTADMFLSTVRRYTRAKVLTPRMLNELVEQIEVHQAEKVNGVHVQRLT